jgi:type II secretory pathway pseudopilin PulG
MRRCERGFSAFELLGVAAIMAVVIVGIGAIFAASRSATNHQLAQDAMIDVTSSLDAAYSSIAAYDPANRAAIAQLPSQTATLTTGLWSATVTVVGAPNGALSIVAQTKAGEQASVLAPLPNPRSP